MFSFRHYHTCKRHVRKAFYVFLLLTALVLVVPYFLLIIPGMTAGPANKLCQTLFVIIFVAIVLRIVSAVGRAIVKTAKGWLPTPTHHPIKH